MTFLLTFKLGQPLRTVSTRIAGCADAAEAEVKLRAIYREEPLVVVKVVEVK